MNIEQLIEGNEYKLIHSHWQPSQKVKVLNKCQKNGKYFSVDIIYTSDDCSKGLITSMNTIECERYLHEITKI